jgi:hypothetical protein
VTKCEYAIEYYDLMAHVARHMESIGGQLSSSEYHYASFGSWWFTFQKKGKHYRVIYDGREREVRFESDPREEKVHGVFLTYWNELIIRHVADLRGAALQPIIVDLIQDGLAKVDVT